jgi:predicted metal-binding protein
MQTMSKSCTQFTVQQANAQFTSHMQILHSELTVHAVQCSAQCNSKRPTAAERPDCFSALMDTAALGALLII